MEKGSRIKVAISVFIVLAVVIVLVFITLNKETNIMNEDSINPEELSSIQKEGVKITILREGPGEAIKIGDSASVNYTGSLADGTVFDSNVDPKFGHVEAFTFTLGEGQVIRGWEIGVEGMKVGEKRKLEIAPEYAYGEYGAGGVIPPNATISFEVELLKIN